ncbi:MAG: M28 family peptidase [Planctomycetaceae bacterium]
MPIRTWKWLFTLTVIFGAIGRADEPAAPQSKALLLGKAPVVRLPGESFRGALPKLTEDETRLAKSLRQSVEKLASDIGERNLREYDHLCDAANWLEKTLTDSGYEVERQSFRVDGRDCSNLIVERAGKTRPDEIVLIGAHYDSALGAPGANDNGSGTAALLELAKRFSKIEPNRTLRLVFFVNEEPPHFQSETMGSLVCARRCKERKEDLTAVLSLETIGYYSDEEGSQNYPAPLGAVFPKTGNFLGFVGNVDSGPLVHRVLSSFRKHADFPSEATSLPGTIRGVGWSDQWSFWEFGYQGVMVTDTAPFRYPHYHRATDTPDKLDYDRMARVVAGLQKVIGDLANPADEDSGPDQKILKTSPAKKIKSR